jgi:hypothetical protein
MVYLATWISSSLALRSILRGQSKENLIGRALCGCNASVFLALHERADALEERLDIARAIAAESAVLLHQTFLFSKKETLFGDSQAVH